MGNVYLEWQQIPLKQEEYTLSVSVEEGVLKHPVAVNVGNPHAVFFLQYKEIEDVPLEKLGPKVENHIMFPEKVNAKSPMWSTAARSACASGSAGLA